MLALESGPPQKQIEAPADCCEGGQCDGSCCAVFYFPRTPRQIKEAIDDDGAYNGNDGMMIANMLIPLTVEEAGERAERFGLRTMPNTTKLYTCKHWDEETRGCTVYEHRPEMCRLYPYGKECEHGCGWAGGKPYGRARG